MRRLNQVGGASTVPQTGKQSCEFERKTGTAQAQPRTHPATRLHTHLHEHDVLVGNPAVHRFGDQLHGSGDDVTLDGDQDYLQVCGEGLQDLRAGTSTESGHFQAQPQGIQITSHLEPKTTSTSGKEDEIAE